jgi:hypothetical protein
VPVDVQLVAAVEDECCFGAGRKVQGEGAVQAAAGEPPQLAPRAGAGNDEFCRLSLQHRRYTSCHGGSLSQLRQSDTFLY